MEESQLNQSQQWFSKYKTTSQEVEKTAQYQPLIDWYDQNYEVFEGVLMLQKNAVNFYINILEILLI
ncbi:MAG: hypothetical protein WBA93_27535 [Microcoleaceae cyanobacterium]